MISGTELSEPALAKRVPRLVYILAEDCGVVLGPAVLARGLKGAHEWPVWVSNCGANEGREHSISQL